MKQAILIALGDELLSGARREGNCGWLANRLALAGWRVLRMEIIPDGLGVLEETLSLHVGKADLVVVSGGLGPTHDDCTRTALARFLGVPLQIDHAAYDTILSRYPAELKTTLEMCRSSQGAIPEGTFSIHNPRGSALGIYFIKDTTRIFAFPGVPEEFKAMAEQELAADLLLNDRCMLSVIVVGWPEVLLKDRIGHITANPSLNISILPSPGTVEIILRGAPAAIDEAAHNLRALFPGDCLSEGCFSTAQDLLLTARRKGLTVACAESCTGGLVGAALTDIPGSSDVFLGSAVCYSNAAKQSVLSVSENTIKEYGAVSGECALEMARGAKNQFGSDVALAVTGVAGPAGGTDSKPVGTVWFALAGARAERAFVYNFSGDRNQIRIRATHTALAALRKAILEMNENG